MRHLGRKIIFRYWLNLHTKLDTTEVCIDRQTWVKVCTASTLVCVVLTLGKAPVCTGVAAVCSFVAAWTPDCMMKTVCDEWGETVAW